MEELVLKFRRPEERKVVLEKPGDVFSLCVICFYLNLLLFFFLSFLVGLYVCSVDLDHLCGNLFVSGCCFFPLCPKQKVTTCEPA